MDGGQLSALLESDRRLRRRSRNHETRILQNRNLSISGRPCSQLCSEARSAPPSSLRPIGSPCRMQFKRRSRPTSTCLWPKPRVEEAEGARQRSMSAALLPRVNAQTYANYQNRDLRALGISLPARLPASPMSSGRFQTTIFSIYAQQNVIDLESYRALEGQRARARCGQDG